MKTLVMTTLGFTSAGVAAGSSGVIGLGIASGVIGLAVDATVDATGTAASNAIQSAVEYADEEVEVAEKGAVQGFWNYMDTGSVLGNVDEGY